MIDVADLSLGEDWRQAIDRMVSVASIMVVLISPNWQQRFDDAGEFVRFEVGCALSRGIPVIPVLLDGASMPLEDKLPPDLKALTRRQTLTLSDTQFNRDANKLIRAIKGVALRPQPFSQMAGTRDSRAENPYTEAPESAADVIPDDWMK
jgi:hypothetical protein